MYLSIQKLILTQHVELWSDPTTTPSNGTDKGDEHHLSTTVACNLKPVNYLYRSSKAFLYLYEFDNCYRSYSHHFNTVTLELFDIYKETMLECKLLLNLTKCCSVLFLQLL